MAAQAAQFDLSTSFVDIPKTLGYGLVRGAGNLILQQELADKSRVAFYMLGEGPWDSILRLWINNNRVTLPAAGIVHFHPGLDGEIGNGLAAVSTGSDQHVDQFLTLIPGGLDPITFSRYAWLALKVAADPAAPSAQLTVLADYQAMQVRQFDAGGNQTAFAWTQNWAWIICDFLIRKFVLREGKVNQPLVAAELARFDWASFSAAATYYDAVLSGGQKRFSDGGVVYVNDAQTADRVLEQMLMMCRSYLLERNGKLSLYADQPRASVFTFTSDNTAPLSSRIVPSANVATSAGGRMTFKGRKSNLRAATNRLLPSYRDLNLASGSSDDATRFAIASSPQLNHEAHQRNVGARGPGLSVLPKVTELAVDLGVNTPERVWRILDSMLVRQLGDDVDGNSAYSAPFSGDWTGYEDSLAVEPGDVVMIDKSISEEFGGKLMEVLQIEEVPDGTRNFTALEYMPNAFPDAAPPQQGLEAPNPGTGLPPAAVAGSVARSVGKNMLGNPGFESNLVGTPLNTLLALGQSATDEWSVRALSAFHKVVVNSAGGRSGANTLEIDLLTGVTIPSDGVGYAAVVGTTFKIPVRVASTSGPGDIVRVAGYRIWNSNATPPAGVTLGQGIQVQLFDANDNNLGTLGPFLFTATNLGGPDPWVLIQGALAIPSTFGGGVPAYGRAILIATVTNSSGSPFATVASFYANCIFDDLTVTVQNTAFDLTPANSSGRATNPASPLSQVGATTQINVASRTYQFPDGSTTPNAGSRDPGSLGKWFVFFDDPTYAGGAVTYQASLNESDLYAANGRISCGSITTVGGGGATGVGGGGAGGGRVALP